MAGAEENAQRTLAKTLVSIKNMKCSILNICSVILLALSHICYPSDNLPNSIGKDIKEVKDDLHDIRRLNSQDILNGYGVFDFPIFLGKQTQIERIGFGARFGGGFCRNHLGFDFDLGFTARDIKDTVRVRNKKEKYTNVFMGSLKIGVSTPFLVREWDYKHYYFIAALKLGIESWRFHADNVKSRASYPFPTIGAELQYHFKLYGFYTPAGDLALPKCIIVGFYHPFADIRLDTANQTAVFFRLGFSGGHIF